MSGIIDFGKYLEDLKKKIEEKEKLGEKVHPVHEIVNTYLKTRDWDKFTKQEYIARKIFYGRLCAEAKLLLESCGGKLEDALWSIDQMNYKANKGRFEWTIRTCLKHNLK
jgi:hypothetical protein